ncbi:hypothetical protein [Lentilactobacillus otakiensis]|uniref:hypothetical protein n=2 Tax=Lentilactobacillus otakiensis TaxID=481720 RepID=UPI003D17FBA1
MTLPQTPNQKINHAIELRAEFYGGTQMKNLEKYTHDVTDDMDAFFADMMQDSSYRNEVNAEKHKLASAAAVLEARESDCEN